MPNPDYYNMDTHEMRETIQDDREVEIKLANLRNLFFEVDPVDVSVEDFVELYLLVARKLREET